MDCINITSASQLHQCGQIRINDVHPLQIAIPLYGFLAPALILFTVFTNSTILTILLRPQLRTSTNQILMAMAVAEMGTGLCSMPWFLYYYTFNGYKDDLSTFWCSYHRLFGDKFPTIFHTTATWLTVFLAIQRYCHIRLSYAATDFISVNLTRLFVFGVFLTAAITTTPDIFAFEGHIFKLPPHFLNVTNAEELNGAHTTVCMLRVRSWVTSLGAQNVISAIYYMRAFAFHLIPAVLLVVFGVALLTKLRAIQDFRTRSFRSTVGAPLHRAESDPLSLGTITTTERRRSVGSAVRQIQSSTIMLILVMLIFVIIEVPEAIIFVTHVVLVRLQMSPISYYGVVNRVLMFRNVFILAVYPLNFCIYCGMSSQFRQSVRQIIRFRCRTNQATRTTGLKQSSRRQPLLEQERNDADSVLHTFRKYDTVKADTMLRSPSQSHVSTVEWNACTDTML